MANPDHLKILKQGVKVWNTWRKEHPDERINLAGAVLERARLPDVNLSGVNLSGAYLFGTDFDVANLIGANLRGADLEDVNFLQANLTGSNLAKAHLRQATLFRAKLAKASLRKAYLLEADLSETDLSEADLSGADLTRALIRGANLRRADLKEAILREANLGGTDLSGADFTRADLAGASLIHANMANATLNSCLIYGISAWDVQLNDANQLGLVITDPYSHEPIITVDDLEVAQFVYLLINHQKLRNVIDSVTERGVLILGRFGGGGLEVLQAIAARLRQDDYLPIIFDFERPQDRNYTETIKTLTGLARFVIVDLSGPSVPQELYATVPHFKIPFVPIIEADRKPYSMALDILEYPWVVRPPVIFTTIEELLEQMPTKIIAPAEEKHQARQKLLDELFKKA